MTLEESIRFHTEEAEKMKLHKKVNEIILGTEGYERALQEHTQTAEWLRELQERRKQPEIIRCGECKFSCKCDDSDIAYYAGYEDEVYCSEHDIYKHADWFCADAERRTDG